MNNALNTYRQTSIKTSGPGKLVVMLYDEAIKQLDAAITNLESNKPKLDSAHNSIVKTQDIITELTVSLDFEKGGDIATNLYNLYMYFNSTLMDANMKKDIQPLKDIRKLMDELRVAWVEAAKVSPVQDKSATPTGSGINIAG